MTIPSFLIRFLHPVRRLYWRIAKPVRHGVKLMAFNETEALLLVRHAYGRTDLWMLPGGAIDRGESAATAARRELMEETAFVAQNLAPFSHYVTEAEGKRDHIALFSCRVTGEANIDGQELIEARFFALDALPDTISPATLRRVRDWQQGTARSDRW